MSEYDRGYKDGVQATWVRSLVLGTALVALSVLLGGQCLRHCVAHAHAHGVYSEPAAAMGGEPLTLAHPLPRRATRASSGGTYPECLPRDCHRDLRAAGAEPWEVTALCDVIASGNIGKGWTDYVRVTADEIAMGIAHFTAGRGRLPLPPPRPDCSDLAHYWRAVAYLYSDESAAGVLRSWRRLVRPTVAEGTQHGLDPVVVASIANSGPGRAVRLVRRCREDTCCLAREYAGRSAHRARRVRALGLGQCVR